MMHYKLKTPINNADAHLRGAAWINNHTITLSFTNTTNSNQYFQHLVRANTSSFKQTKSREYFRIATYTTKEIPIHTTGLNGTYKIITDQEPDQWNTITLTTKQKYKVNERGVWDTKTHRNNKIALAADTFKNSKYSKLLPLNLQKILQKTTQNQLLTHDYNSNTTRVFTLDGQIWLTTINPDSTLLATLTHKSLYFFDLD